MDPQDEMEWAGLKAVHERAVSAEEEARFAMYAFLQRVLKNGGRGTLTELIEKTGYSRQRLGDIKAGKWSRTASRNPAQSD